MARSLTRSTAFAATAVAPVMSGVCCGRRQPNGVAFAPIANVRRKVRSQTKEHVFPPISQQRSLAWGANLEPDIAKYKVYWGLESGAPTESLDVGKVTAATIATLGGNFYSGSVAWTIRRSRQLFSGPRYGLSITH